MTSSNDVINFSISAYHLWRHRWGRKIIKKYFLKSFYHSRNLKKNFMRIGLLEKKLWPRVLCMTSSLFPYITQISKIAVNHNFWPILIILDGNESWWPKFYEQYFTYLWGIYDVIIVQIYWTTKLCRFVTHWHRFITHCFLLNLHIFLIAVFFLLIMHLESWYTYTFFLHGEIV